MTTIRQTLERLMDGRTTLDRRDALRVLGAGVALAGIGVASVATAQDSAPASGKKAAKPELVVVETTRENLDPAKYVARTGQPPVSEIGIICQFGTKYYVDHKEANNVVGIYFEKSAAKP